jgi:hypothetical protein
VKGTIKEREKKNESGKIRNKYKKVEESAQAIQTLHERQEGSLKIDRATSRERVTLIRINREMEKSKRQTDKA